MFAKACVELCAHVGVCLCTNDYGMCSSVTHWPRARGGRRRIGLPCGRWRWRYVVCATACMGVLARTCHGRARPCALLLTRYGTCAQLHLSLSSRDVHPTAPNSHTHAHTRTRTHAHTHTHTHTHTHVTRVRACAAGGGAGAGAKSASSKRAPRSEFAAVSLVCWCV